MIISKGPRISRRVSYFSRGDNFHNNKILKYENSIKTTKNEIELKQTKLEVATIWHQLIILKTHKTRKVFILPLINEEWYFLIKYFQLINIEDRITISPFCKL